MVEKTCKWEGLRRCVQEPKMGVGWERGISDATSRGQKQGTHGVLRLIVSSLSKRTCAKAAMLYTREVELDGRHSLPCLISLFPYGG